MNDLAYESARSIAAAIREGKLKSRDHLEAMLDRIERLNGPLNAVVTLDASARGAKLTLPMPRSAAERSSVHCTVYA